MGGITPDWMLGLVFRRQHFGPNHLAVLGVEAEEVAHRAERINLALVNQRCATRTGWIAEFLVGTIVFVLPDFLAGLGVDAKHAFLARRCLLGKRILDLGALGRA